MPVPNLFYTSGIAAPVALATNVETVVATVRGIALQQYARQVRLSGKAVVVSGTTTTAVVVRIRRASLTGTLVSDETGQTVITAAGDSNAYPVEAVDSPGDGTGFVYVLTVQDTGGGTGGTTVYATLDAVAF